MGDCSACGTEVLKVRVDGRTITINADPSPGGTIAAHKNGAGGYTARRAELGETVVFPEHRHQEHQPVCSGAPAQHDVSEPKHERPSAGTMDDVRRARAQLAKQKRRDRWRRKPPPITGIRKAQR